MAPMAKGQEGKAGQAPLKELVERVAEDVEPHVRPVDGVQ